MIHSPITLKHIVVLRRFCNSNTRKK